MNHVLVEAINLALEYEIDICFSGRFVGIYEDYGQYHKIIQFTDIESLRKAIYQAVTFIKENDDEYTN